VILCQLQILSVCLRSLSVIPANITRVTSGLLLVFFEITWELLQQISFTSSSCDDLLKKFTQMMEIDRLSTLKLNATFHDLLYNDENNFIVLIVYFFPFFCCSCNCICKLELFVLWLCDLILLNGVKQFLGDRKGIRPVKSWVLVYWW